MKCQKIVFPKSQVESVKAANNYAQFGVGHSQNNDFASCDLLPTLDSILTSVDLIRTPHYTCLAVLAFPFPCSNSNRVCKSYTQKSQNSLTVSQHNWPPCLKQIFQENSSVMATLLHYLHCLQSCSTEFTGPDGLISISP